MFIDNAPLINQNSACILAKHGDERYGELRERRPHASVSKHFWISTIGETFICRGELENSTDAQVAMAANLIVVGDVPRKISEACSVFLR